MNLFDIFNIMFFLFFARLVEKYVFKNFISRYREEKELRFHISLPCIVKGLVTLSDNVSIGMQAGEFRGVGSRVVTNPVFAGSGSGTGTTTKGVGVAWIRIFAGIGSTHGIGSFLGLHISNINSGGPISVISCKVS